VAVLALRRSFQQLVLAIVVLAGTPTKALFTTSKSTIPILWIIGAIYAGSLRMNCLSVLVAWDKEIKASEKGLLLGDWTIAMRLVNSVASYATAAIQL